MELSVGGLGVHAVIHRDCKKTKLVFLQMLIAAYFSYICEFFSHKIVNMFFPMYETPLARPASGRFLPGLVNGTVVVFDAASGRCCEVFFPTHRSMYLSRSGICSSDFTFFDILCFGEKSQWSQYLHELVPWNAHLGVPVQRIRWDQRYSAATAHHRW